jgi:hypothetical protein
VPVRSSARGRDEPLNAIVRGPNAHLFGQPMKLQLERLERAATQAANDRDMAGALVTSSLRTSFSGGASFR